MCFICGILSIIKEIIHLRYWTLLSLIIEKQLLLEYIVLNLKWFLFKFRCGRHFFINFSLCADCSIWFILHFIIFLEFLSLQNKILFLYFIFIIFNDFKAFHTCLLIRSCFILIFFFLTRNLEEFIYVKSGTFLFITMLHVLDKWTASIILNFSRSNIEIIEFILIKFEFSLSFLVLVFGRLLLYSHCISLFA